MCQKKWQILVHMLKWIFTCIIKGDVGGDVVDIEVMGGDTELSTPVLITAMTRDHRVNQHLPESHINM